ncbi:MAG: prepilin-type N-terminal cleavage/methylation domain-containing protein [Thermodesulfobacteriota bacterium]
MSETRRPGFTFIELMLVITIIGLLAAIAVPQFAAYMQRPRREAVKVLLAEIGSLQREYRAEHGRFISCPVNPSAPQASWRDLGAWKELGFDPRQPLYGFQLQVEATGDTFRASGLLDGREIFYATEKTYEIIATDR